MHRHYAVLQISYRSPVIRVSKYFGMAASDHIMQYVYV